MTPEQIQNYNRKCAELMGEESYKRYSNYHKSEIVFVNYQCGNYMSAEYHINWTWQIPVWQKVSEILYAKLYGMDYLPILFHNAEKIEEDYYEEIRKGAPQSAFEFLCQGIDFIEQFKTEKKLKINY